MPYVPKERRNLLSVRRHRGTRVVAANPGELNYVFTEILQEYLNKRGLCYQAINDIIGALDQAADEFRRRVVHRYEDRKILDNGDVYDNHYTGEEV